MKKLLLLSTVLYLFTSCEKEIDIDLNAADPKIVIEGAITNVAGPYFVKITETVNFSDGNDYPPITDAIVIVKDNFGAIDTLTQSSPGIYETNFIVGMPGNTYTLSVAAKGKSYEATSTMPFLVNLDSLRFEKFGGFGGADNYSTIPVFTDPEPKGNNYRFLLTNNNELDPSYIVDNDNINSGKTNERPIFLPDTEINLGDSVIVEMRCIDLTTYNYYFTLAQIAGGGPGGGTTPSNPPNNITGNESLGIFSAFTTQTIKKVVK